MLSIKAAHIRQNLAFGTTAGSPNKVGHEMHSEPTFIQCHCMHGRVIKISSEIIWWPWPFTSHIMCWSLSLTLRFISAWRSYQCCSAPRGSIGCTRSKVWWLRYIFLHVTQDFSVCPSALYLPATLFYVCMYACMYVSRGLIACARTKLSTSLLVSQICFPGFGQSVCWPFFCLSVCLNSVIQHRKTVKTIFLLMPILTVSVSRVGWLCTWKKPIRIRADKAALCSTTDWCAIHW